MINAPQNVRKWMSQEPLDPLLMDFDLLPMDCLPVPADEDRLPVPADEDRRQAGGRQAGRQAEGRQAKSIGSWITG
jgi:hypothetical protein